MFIASERVVCPPRAGCPFHTTAKRYWMPEFTANQDDPDALTLILLHSTSFHKETWEPTLHQIFQRARRPGSDPTLLVLREAWALDCPNHGEAVQYNEDVLHEEEHAKEGFTCQKYAHAIHSFLSAGVNEGARVNFEKRRLVGIGHSLGANAILLAQQYEPRLPFSSIVIIEPMVSPKGVTHMKDLGRSLIENALRRRDVWGSREDAVTHFTKATDWDTRVIRLFAEYGLRATTHHPGSGQHGVALACTREQEAGAEQPVQAINDICTLIPVHLILGKQHDLIAADIQQALIDPASGRSFASIRYIENVGHLIPQTQPDRLGSAICETLSLMQPKSRL